MDEHERAAQARRKLPPEAFLDDGRVVWLQVARSLNGDGRGGIDALEDPEGPGNWSATWATAAGDLIIIKRGWRDGHAITDLLEVTGGPYVSEPDAWSEKSTDRFVDVDHLGTLADPITAPELYGHPRLSRMNAVRASFIGRYRITPWWKDLYELIVARNPGLRSKLTPWMP